jgi:hypothetical protein
MYGGGATNHLTGSQEAAAEWEGVGLSEEAEAEGVGLSEAAEAEAVGLSEEAEAVEGLGLEEEGVG